MTCRWIKRSNLRDYCATCNFGSRIGCLVEITLTGRDYKYDRSPAEFPRVPA